MLHIPSPATVRETFPAVVTPKRIFTLILVLIMLHLLCGCKSSQRLADTQIVTHTIHDTLYTIQEKYDSIYIDRWHSKEYHPFQTTPNPSEPIQTTPNPSEPFRTPQNYSEPFRTDTLFIKDVSIEYRYKLLRDTIRVVKTDSIPVIRTVTLTEQKLYKPLYLTIFAWIGSFTVGYFIVTLIIFLIKLFK